MNEGSISHSIPPQPRSRLAPTPSGFLHRGNLYSFLLTWLAVRRRGGSLHLRIDDMDSRRKRPEYVEDIFRSLEFLGLDWDTGPGGPGDLDQRWSQRFRMEAYRDFLERLRREDLVFPCTCTRRELREAAVQAEAQGSASRGGCLGGCPREGRPAAWRLRTDRCPGGARLTPEMREFVLWRKDNLPAYQLTCVVDDGLDGITWIVRGEDLAEPPRAQGALTRRPGWAMPPVYHHRLVRAGDGRKLSKSAGNGPYGRSLGAFRQGDLSPREAEALRRDFLRDFCSWAAGPRPGTRAWEICPGVSRPADLLHLPKEFFEGEGFSGIP